MRRFVVDAALAFQITGLIACSVLGSLFLGIWLDRRLGSAPWIMLALMVIGLAAATLGAYRLVKRLNERK
jgi:F0F1-type ATP synthase assembly protein I